MGEQKASIIEFKRIKPSHFINYTEEQFFKEFPDINPYNYDIEEVARKMNINIKYSIEEFPENKNNIYSIIEIKDKNNIFININNSNENINKFKYDIINASLGAITRTILPNSSDFENKYVLMGMLEVRSFSFFKKHYLTQKETLHKDISFKLPSYIKKYTSKFLKGSLITLGIGALFLITVLTLKFFSLI